MKGEESAVVAVNMKIGWHSFKSSKQVTKEGFVTA